MLVECIKAGMGVGFPESSAISGLGGRTEVHFDHPLIWRRMVGGTGFNVITLHDTVTLELPSPELVVTATAFNLSESADQIPAPFKRSEDSYGKPALEGGVPLTRHRRIKSYDLSAS